MVKKKLLIWTLCAAFVLSLTACEESDAPAVEEVELTDLSEAVSEENSEEVSSEEEESVLDGDTEFSEEAAETDGTEAVEESETQEAEAENEAETGESDSDTENTEMTEVEETTVSAAAVTQSSTSTTSTTVILSDGTVFDAVYYADTYSDVKALYGYNTEALLNHYLNYGKAERRSSCGTVVTLSDGTVFDAEYYANTYADVKASCGTDMAALLNHYLTYGVKEGRKPSAEGTAAATTTVSVASTASSASDSGHQISGFSIIYQNPELPTGCESVAATMLINYYGISADKLDLADNYLPKVSASFYYDANGNKIGPDMENYFVGDPRGSGYICGVPAILTEVNSYLAAQGSSLQAVNKTGISLSDLYSCIDNDTPVLVWVTISMAARKATYGWYTEDGRWMEYATNDHGAVLIGYTDTTVTIADPISGIVEYSRTQFEKVFASRGNKALIIQ